MAVVFDPTLGGINTNSYASLIEADAYFASEKLITDAWDALATDTDKKKKALIAVFNRMETIRFVGQKKTTTQRSQWPMVFDVAEFDDLSDEPDDVINGLAIPREVIISQCEWAYAWLASGVDPSAQNPLSQFSALSVPGVVSLTLRDDQSSYQDAMPDIVRRNLQKYQGDGSVRLERA